MKINILKKIRENTTIKYNKSHFKLRVYNPVDVLDWVEYECTTTEQVLERSLRLIWGRVKFLRKYKTNSERKLNRQQKRKIKSLMFFY